MNRFLLPLVVVLVVFFYGASLPTVAVASDDQKSVLVTGASTGIGRNLAETLAELGHHVYAGARKDEDLAALNAIDNITAVRLDVTKQDEIDAVVALIEESGTGLYGLVNNAGIGDGGPIVETPVEVQTLVYDVNVEGVYPGDQGFRAAGDGIKGADRHYRFHCRHAGLARRQRVQRQQALDRGAHGFSRGRNGAAWCVGQRDRAGQFPVANPPKRRLAQTGPRGCSRWRDHP